MLSYQHQYHAGNHADVLKHWLLVECIQYLQKKEKPFEYIDTHAGAGLYKLDSELALKTSEFKSGIDRLLKNPVPGMENYLALVSPLVNRQKYPGSPELVKQLLRSEDRSWLFEMHPATVRELKKHSETRGRIFVRQEDGFQGMQALLPNSYRRALVLTDPSYEVKSDYQTVVNTITKAWHKMPQTVFLLWYPVVERRRINQLESDLQKTDLKNVELFELSVRNDEEKGMTGSGMIIVNPPWTLKSKAKEILPRLSEVLSDDNQCRIRQKCLIPE